MVGTEAVQLMGATAVGHDEYLQQGAVVNETAADIIEPTSSRSSEPTHSVLPDGDVT